MKKTRYLIEFGQGADLHGEDATNAASKAIKDAMSHCCMCGSVEIPAAYGRNTRLEIHIRVGVPRHETVDRSALCRLIPEPDAEVHIEIAEGGLLADGAYNPPNFDVCGHILIADAVITVWLIEQSKLEEP